MLSPELTRVLVYTLALLAIVVAGQLALNVVKYVESKMRRKKVARFRDLFRTK